MTSLSTLSTIVVNMIPPSNIFNLSFYNTKPNDNDDSGSGEDKSCLCNNYGGIVVWIVIILIMFCIPICVLASFCCDSYLYVFRRHYVRGYGYSYERDEDDTSDYDDTSMHSYDSEYIDDSESTDTIIYNTHSLRNVQELYTKPIVTNCNEHKCSICLSNINSNAEFGDTIKLKGCRHLFHESCINKWFSYKQFTCPICRKEL